MHVFSLTFQLPSEAYTVILFSHWANGALQIGCTSGSSGCSDDKLKLTSSEPNFSALFPRITEISTRVQGKTQDFFCEAILCGEWGNMRISFIY